MANDQWWHTGNSRLINIAGCLLLLFYTLFSTLQAQGAELNVDAQVDQMAPNVPVVIQGGDQQILAPKERLELVRFATDQKRYEFKTVSFVIEVKNTGGTAIVPLGQIDIKNSFGQQVGKLVINPEMLSIPAGESMTLSPIWNPPLPFGIGRYRAYLRLEYGLSSQIMSAAHFWIVPIRLIAEIGIAIIIIFLLLNQLLGLELTRKEEALRWKRRLRLR